MKANNNSGKSYKPKSVKEKQSPKGQEKPKAYGKKFDKASKYAEVPEYKKKKSADKKKFIEPSARKNKVRSLNDDSYYADERSAKPKIIKKHTKSDINKETEGTRLNKYLSNAGICSRREADTLISAGLVSVNGKIITELGVKVMPYDEVKFNGEKVNPEKKVYILLNKPKDYVTTLDDPQGRKTVMELLKGACSERVYPVGRLDRNTTGLLLLTNDGELTKKLTHPKYNKKKIYHVVLEAPAAIEHIEQIISGIELEDGFIKADQVDYVNGLQNEIGIELHSGRNRIVRRIFEHFGYNIKRLDRVYFAGLTKLNLPRGKWRYLSEKEIIILKTGMYE
jgi:23S rRNA pseudouridine2605 synthase